MSPSTVSEAGLEASSGFMAPSLTFPDTCYISWQRGGKEEEENKDGESGCGGGAKEEEIPSA